MWQEVWACRRALAVEHKMLQEPPEKSNFLTTTLRRLAPPLIHFLMHSPALSPSDCVLCLSPTHFTHPYTYTYTYTWLI